MIKAIFFDFNGVIIDDELLQMKAYEEVLREHGIALTKEWYFSALGMDDVTFIRSMFERANKSLTDEVLAEVQNKKTDLHRKMIEDELPLFPGVVTFLKAAAREFSLGLVSMASTQEISYVLERANLKQLFSVAVMAGDVPSCKPAPDCYQCGLEKLNEQRRSERLPPVFANECLAIEDSPPGVESASRAGMRTLGITNTVTDDELRAAGADIVTRSLADWTPDAVKLVFS
ncbi:MAG TPA: HAD family phosphatase [Pyrinomonadaceae bacterium]|nr:HAD family phosphatase [Pyrinomonadaceae bacterium]